jgi:hypothetical protein
MKKWIFTRLFLTAAVCFFISVETKAGLFGSKSKSGKPGNFNKGKLLLSVDFEPNVPLKYNFVCERQIALDLSGKYSKGRKDRGKAHNFTEKLEMEIVYKPLQIDPYGYSTIEATCNSAKATRSSESGRGRDKGDAVESVIGKSFTFKITPTGKVVDYNSLENLVKELGEKAFGEGSKRGRVKDPDMVMDFLATQWNIWDSVSSIKNPLKGLKKGRKWSSQLLAPMPFVSKTGRDVEYQFAGVTEANGVSLAEITSSYKLSQESPRGVCLPYSGSFQMRGTFGFLRGYQMLSIEGTGRQLYDIERGLIKSDTQQYQAKVSASIFGLGSGTLEPNIIIDQTITMKLVE